MRDLPNEMSTIEIMGILPHRYPFLLVDQVLEIKRPADSKNRVGSEIVAVKCVTVNEPFFEGHFPDQPIMPGVLVIEALAQASGLCGYYPHPTNGTWKFFILGIDKARFRKPILPGQRLILNSKLIKERSNFLTFQCSAKNDNELMCEAEIFAQMVP